MASLVCVEKSPRQNLTSCHQQHLDWSPKISAKPPARAEAKVHQSARHFGFVWIQHEYKPQKLLKEHQFYSVKSKLLILTLSQHIFTKAIQKIRLTSQRNRISYVTQPVPTKHPPRASSPSPHPTPALPIRPVPPQLPDRCCPKETDDGFVTTAWMVLPCFETLKNVDKHDQTIY